MPNTPRTEKEITRFAGFLGEQGLKLTSERTALVREIFATHYHFEADELLFKMKEKGLKISRATVYRTLELLVSADVVDCTVVNSKLFRYQLARDQQHVCHYQLVDLHTGDAVSFDADPELRQVLRRICRERGFNEQYHSLKIFGEFKSRRRRVPRRPSANGSAPQVASAAAAAAPGEPD